MSGDNGEGRSEALMSNYPYGKKSHILNWQLLKY
jgi:hypothetical protein